MKRQAAFAGQGKMLKGALHCHTTRSDGKGTPEKTLRLHLANGYDFAALTDHRFYNFDNYGVDGLTVIPGMELDLNFPEKRVHCHHIVCLGPREGNGFAQDQRFERLFIERPEQTQPTLDMVHRNGNLTIYCHPQWSGTPAREFEMLEGNFAMEIWNSGCAIENRMDMNAAYWDELLIQGKQIYGVAVDDGHEMTHHCNGYVMVRSENSVPAILEALRSGAFYSSCGPVIEDFYVEDGFAHVRCSPVEEICFHHLRTPFPVITRPQSGELTQGSAQLRAGGYVRASVVDAQGRRAWTNPIFLDEEDWA